MSPPVAQLSACYGAVFVCTRIVLGSGGQMPRCLPALAVALALAPLCATAACARHPPVGRSASTPPASASPPPEATPASRAPLIRQWVIAAGLDTSVVGAREPDNEDETAAPKEVCGHQLTTSLHKVASHSWDWHGTKVDNVSHGVYGYEPDPGSAMIAELRANVKECTTSYDWGGIWDLKIVSEQPVATPAGID